MSKLHSLRDPDTRRYRRPGPMAEGPDRRAGGFYRSADDASRRVIGRPLKSTEDAVVNVVRMAYDLADEQIDRSRRLATRLKRAGDAATGGDSDRAALQAGERLAMKLGSSGLAWLETLAAEPGSPMWRLLAAQYRVLGRVFGLAEPPPPAAAPAAAAQPDAGLPERGPSLRAGPLLLARVDGDAPRAVEAALHVFVDPGPGPLHCHFSRRGAAAAGKAAAFEGQIQNDARRGALLLMLPDLWGHQPGAWIAPVCDADGVQLGRVELELL